MRSLIVDKGERYYTYMLKVLRSLEPYYLNYNWLITDIEVYPNDTELEELFGREYVWLSGQRFVEILTAENFQFIWAVASGFSKGIALEDVLSHPLPSAEGFKGFWVDEVDIQHPLAELEIVAWDSSLTIFITKDERLASLFEQGFPQAEDLSERNRRENAEISRIHTILEQELQKRHTAINEDTLHRKYIIWHELFRGRVAPVNDEEIRQAITRMLDS